MDLHIRYITVNMLNNNTCEKNKRKTNQRLFIITYIFETVPNIDIETVCAIKANNCFIGLINHLTNNWPVNNNPFLQIFAKCSKC